MGRRQCPLASQRTNPTEFIQKRSRKCGDGRELGLLILEGGIALVFMTLLGCATECCQESMLVRVVNGQHPDTGTLGYPQFWVLALLVLPEDF